MADLGDDEWALVHEVRLRGIVTAADTARVEALVAVGYLNARGERVVLTAAGREAHRAWARCETGSEAEERPARQFERFLVLNDELLRLCGEWQVKPGGSTNDHRDAA